MAQIKLLGLSGSLRKDSTNTALVKEAARLFGETDVTMGDIRMPLYDGDLEEASGLPSEAEALYDQIQNADGIIISTPEYNSNLPGGLKNALDWVSRKRPSPWTDKPVAIISAAAGRTGGARAQFSLRHCLTPFQPRVLQGPEVMIAGSRDAFDDNGHLLNERSVNGLTALMEKLRAEIARKPA